MQQETGNATMAESSGDLPHGFAVRAPAWSDLQAVTDVMRACEVAETGAAEQTADDLRGDWERARFDLVKDAWVAVAPEGRIAAYAEVWPRADGAHLDAFGHVHPDYCGRGIGSHLLRLMEAWAREHARAAAVARVTLLNIVNHRNEAACGLLESAGYTPVRYYWRLVIDLNPPVPEPRWPEGVTVRTFERGHDDRVVHSAVQEAFADNDGFVPMAFDEWAGFMMQRETFDPAQWFLAVDGDEVAGVALCPDYPEQGWVRQLAVRKPWRRRGVALALLRHAFTEFRRRGKRRAGLVTDSYNRSGSLKLYEKGGMRVDRQHDGYRLEIGG